MSTDDLNNTEHSPFSINSQSSDIPNYRDYSKTLGESFIVYSQVLIQGKDFSKENNLEVRIHQKIAEHDEFEILVPSEAFDERDEIPLIHSRKYLGSRVTIQMIQFEKTAYLFTGVITKISNQRKSGYSYVVLQGKSPTILLEGGRKCRSFENMNVQEIVNNVLKSASLPSDLLNFDIRPTYNPPILYTVQYKESDFDFIQRLAKRYGEWLYYNGQTLVMSQTGSQLIDLVEQQDVYEYVLEMEVKPQKFSYTAYDPKRAQQHSIDSEQIRVEEAVNPFQFDTLKSSEKIFPESPESFYHQSLLEEGQVELSSVVKREKQKRQDVLYLYGKSYNPGIKLGDIVCLKGWMPGHEIFDDGEVPLESYRIIEIEHHHDGANGYHNSFTAVPRELWVPPYYDEVAVPKAEEQSARVVDNDDPEQMNRVRVQFSWQGENEISPWIWLLQAHAGSGKGVQFIPEIGEEVMVGFEAQNMEKPYVIGTRYNGSEKSGHHTPNNDLKVIHTRSGNKVIMNDAEGSIYIEDSSKNMIKLDGKGKIQIKAEQLEIEVGNMKVNTMETTHIVTQDFSLDALKGIDLYSLAMSQNIKSQLKIHTGATYLNSLNKLHLQGQQLQVLGTEELSFYSEQRTSINSEGVVELKGRKANKHTNTPDTIEPEAHEQISLAVVEFRSLTDIETEEIKFGFDFLRLEDNGLAKEEPYKDIIVAGYKDGKESLTQEEAYKKLEKEYHRIPIYSADHTTKEREYFVPYLTLFSKEYVDSLSGNSKIFKKPEYEAELRVLVDIREELDELSFEYDKDIFSLGTETLPDLSKTSGLKESSEQKIKISCNKDFSTQQEILVYAYPKDSKKSPNPKTQRKLAGKILVLPNDKKYRLERKIVIYNISDGNGIAEVGEVLKTALCNALYQALIVPLFEVELIMELPENSLQYYKIDDQSKTIGMDIVESKELELNDFILSNVDKEYKSSEYFKFYSINESYGSVVGYVFAIGNPNILLIGPTINSYYTVLGHEFYHALGLYHTHLEEGEVVIKSGDKKYAFFHAAQNFLWATDNIMSYRKPPAMRSTWFWQWKIANPNLS